MAFTFSGPAFPLYSVVVFCAAFFRIPVDPVGQCMEVGPGNIWDEENADSLIDYQKYVVAHELIHVYLGTDSLREKKSPEEVYLPNDCMGLSRADRLRNPENYIYYIASK